MITQESLTCATSPNSKILGTHSSYHRSGHDTDCFRPTEAARAIRKKLKYGNIHRQSRALTLLDAMLQNGDRRVKCMVMLGFNGSGFGAG